MSQVRCPFLRCVNQRSPTYCEDYRRPTTDTTDPQMASCLRFDHRQAIHPLQPHSSMSHKDSSRLHQAKGEPPPTPRSISFEQASHKAGTHPLDMRQPSQPSKKPTREANKLSKPSRSSPLSTSEHKKKKYRKLTKPFQNDGGGSTRLTLLKMVRIPSSINPTKDGPHPFEY